MLDALPLIVLAGSDRTPVVLPEGAHEHALAGAKGIDIRIGGRPLIDLALERFAQSGLFEPIYVAGPVALYGEQRGEVRVIDTDSTFGDNIQVALAAVRKRHPAQPVALTTCDVLADPEELEALLEDYRIHAPMDFWFPLVKVPEDLRRLGASAWKPQYPIRPFEGQPPVRVLPNHLVVVDPDALQLRLLFRCFELAYQSRNRPIGPRLWLMVRNVIAGLLARDLRLVLRGRAPVRTWTVISNGIQLARGLRSGRITQRELEDRLRKIFVRHSHRRAFPHRRGRVPLVDALSLAKDIDTEEEAAERQGRVRGGGER
jgi:hypothetical protein